MKTEQEIRRIIALSADPTDSRVYRVVYGDHDQAKISEPLREIIRESLKSAEWTVGLLAECGYRHIELVEVIGGWLSLVEEWQLNSDMQKFLRLAGRNST
jgi:hypothetical protein